MNIPTLESVQESICIGFPIVGEKNNAALTQVGSLIL
jgi:hypothetical protein